MTEDALQRWSKATLIGEITNRQGFLVSGLKLVFTMVTYIIYDVVEAMMYFTTISPTSFVP